MTQNSVLVYFVSNTWCEQNNYIEMIINNEYLLQNKTDKILLSIKILSLKIKHITNLLMFKFAKYYIVEKWYDKNILFLVLPYLDSINVEYNIIPKIEVDFILNCIKFKNLPNLNKLKNIINSLDVSAFIQKLKNAKKLQPNFQQKQVLSIINDFYKINNIGKLIWACGLGKTLLSILIVKLLKFKYVVFGVPSRYLQTQFKNEILKIFPDKKNILFVGGDKENNIQSTTNKDDIILFLNNASLFKTKDPIFIITTYHSCNLLTDINNIDFKIGDEAHHLVGFSNENSFRLFHNIKSKKTLYMTGIEKNICTENVGICNMNDEMLFGKYIDIKTVKWAIENKKITDYYVLVIKNTENNIYRILVSLNIENLILNRELFLSAYMCLKSFEKYNNLTHLLLYTNTINEAEIAKNYIDIILDKFILLNLNFINYKQIYNNVLHSKNCDNLESEVNKFKNSKYGIISCVYIFGEGFDLPKLNGVCIAGNMQSEIRIFQYLLRPNRLEINNPNKISYIIIPYIDNGFWESENKSFNKIRYVISQIRNDDDNIEQKIKVLSIETVDLKLNSSENIARVNFELNENAEVLNTIKLRLRHSKNININSEERDEYYYYKTLNINLNIRSRKEYYDNKHLYNNFIDDPKTYFLVKNVWTNWYDFMGIDTNIFIQEKNDWVNFCKEKQIINIEEYFKLCDEYNILPRDPEVFYDHFSNFYHELNLLDPGITN